MIAFLRRGGFRRLAGDRRGNVLTLTAFALPVLLGGAGLGVDTAQWYLWKRELQLAADAGALSGAYALSQGKDHDARAKADATSNINVADLTGNLQVTLGSWGGRTNNAVTVSLSAQHRLAFSSMFLPTPPTISATATAAVVNDGEHCMISLNTQAARAINIGGNATVSLGCGISTNSRNEEAILVDGNAQVNANPLSAVGGINAAVARLVGQTTKRQYSAPQDDPLASLTLPSLTLDEPTYRGNEDELPDGIYYGLSLTKSHTLNGIYVIDGSRAPNGTRASLSIAGNSTLTGTAIIILKNGATLNISGGSEIDLEAPSATEAAAWGLGTSFGDVLIFEDKSTSTGGTSLITGNTKLHLSGAIYLPRQNVQITGNTTPSTECMLLIADTITINGNPIVPSTCPAGTYSQFDIGARVVRLVQ